MNRATRMVATVFGIVFAIGGMSHGVFEIFQGNTPTNGVMIAAISESMQMWEHGAETALTIIPNFLLTGIAAISVSSAIIVWSLQYLHTRHGATVFLLLFVLLFLVGGGVAQVIFFVPAWAFATRINQPLTWWRRTLPDGLRRAFASIWRWTLGIASVAMLFALAIAVFGYVPGLTDDDQVLGVMVLLLLVAIVGYPVSFVAAIAADIERQDAPQLAMAG